MSNKFDDLFNEFFKGRNENPLQDEISKIIQALSMYNAHELDEKDFENQVDANLGEPDEVTERIEDGLLYKKMVWNTPQGQFVKIIVSDAPNGESLEFEDIDLTPVAPSLAEQLEAAVEAEDYDLAIKLRDQIKKDKKSRK